MGKFCRLKICQLFMFCGSFVVPLQAGEHHALNLSGAVSYALMRVPAFASMKKKAAISELSLTSAHYSFFPRLSLGLTSGVNTSLPRWPSLWSNALTVALHQPLMSHSANGVTLALAKTKVDIATLDAQIERDLLCMKVVKDFYAFSAVVEQQHIRKQKLKALLKQLNLVTRRFEQGFKTKRDVLRFEAQVQRAQIQQAAADNRIEQMRDTLIATITGSNRQQLTDTFEFTPVILPVQSTVNIPSVAPAIEHHALYKKLQLEHDMASLDVDLTKRKLWPEMSATASVLGNADLGFVRARLFEPTATVMIGLSLNYDLFDFGTRRRETAIALKNREIKADAIQTQLSTETTIITQMMVNLSLLKEGLELNQKLLILEEDNFKKIEHDYLQGKAQYLDVISALDNLSDVKSALSTSLFDIATQMTTHRYYEGTLYDWLF